MRLRNRILNKKNYGKHIKISLAKKKIIYHFFVQN